jgi:hypothetical protein
LTDVRFADARTDPIGAATRVLAAVGLEPTDASVHAMRAWIAQDRKRDALATHRYTAADFGLTPELIRERFAAYSQRFL